MFPMMFPSLPASGDIVAGEELLAGKQRCFETNSEIFLLRKECFQCFQYARNIDFAIKYAQIRQECEPIFLTKMSHGLENMEKH